MVSNKQRIIVLVPVYKDKPAEHELLSIARAETVLRDYSLAFVAPEQLDVSAYQTAFPGFSVCRFADNYFTNVKAYTRLLVSPNFYGRFKDNFDYLLIYQTDAYVFRDDLLDWCNKGYDYIGPPWVEEPPKLKKRNLLPLSRWMKGKVGNGGLSLRKIRSHWWNAWLFRPFTLLGFNEDFFWCMIVGRINPFYTIPGWKEALGFGFELAPSRCWELNGHQLPFGCHAWEKYEPDFWKPFMPEMV